MYSVKRGRQAANRWRNGSEFSLYKLYIHFYIVKKTKANMINLLR